MVYQNRSSRISWPARLPPARAIACVLAILLFTVMTVPGCQQSARFAQGSGGSLTPIAAKPKPEREPQSVVLMPLTPIPDMPSGPAVSGSFPASWGPSARNRPWRWIVIHHSATAEGGAARFDRQHRNNGWDELGYHFVIGNGSDTRDGLVEVGPRWSKQKHGAHAKTPDNRFNDFGIGICLVGNFDQTRPSDQQLQSLASLVAFLMKRYDIPAAHVIGHDDTGRSTACPGRHLEAQLPGVRRLASRAVANGFAVSEPRPPAQFASDRSR